MFCCCSKIFKQSQIKSDTSPALRSSQNYTLNIEAPSVVSNQSPNPRTDSQLETLTDTSSFPCSIDPAVTVVPQYPLYFPSRDSLVPSSELVNTESKNFESILDLEADVDWEVKVEKSNVIIMVRTGSKNHPELPMMKAFFDFEIDVEPQLVYDVIYDPDIRKKWDNSLAEYNLIQKQNDVIQYYMHNKAPWPFDDRDFVETRFLRNRCNGDLEVYFRASVSEQYSETHEKIVRGETILGGQIFRRRISPNTGKMSLIVTTIVQADIKGEVPKKLLRVTFPATVLSWFRSVKKQVDIRAKLIE